MERAILNNLSTAAIIALLVGGVVVLTLAGVLLARRLLPDLADSRFDHVVDNLRTVYELIFALILAFVIAAVLDTMSDAEATVATEATEIAQLQRGLDAFDARQTGPVNDALRTYVHELADDEWQTMQHGEDSKRATSALEAVGIEYRRLRAKSQAQQETFSQGLDKLDDIAAQRRDRLNIAAADLPTLLRVLVAIGIVLLLILEYRPALARGASLAFMGALAAIVMSTYLLTLVLNYPFSGSISVSSDPLKEDRLASFWEKELQYEPEDGDRRVALTPDDLRGALNGNTFGTLVMRCYRPADKPGPGTDVPDTCRRTDDWYGVYRFNDGVVTGRLSKQGVFHGWWTERPPKVQRDGTGGAAGRGAKVDNSGAFSWRGVRRSGRTLIVGCWIYGAGGRAGQDAVYQGWDMEKLGTKDKPFDEPRDLRRRFTKITFRSAPPAPRTPQPVRDCVRPAS